MNGWMNHCMYVSLYARMYIYNMYVYVHVCITIILCHLLCICIMYVCAHASVCGGSMAWVVDSWLNGWVIALVIR